MFVDRGRPLFAFLVFCLILLLPMSVCRGQAGDRPTSLQIVPQSAAFYWASMNHQAQYNAVVESKAWDNVMNSVIGERMRTAYRSGRRRGWEQFGQGNPFADYLEGYSESIGSVPGKMALSMCSQIVGNEVFVYADEDWLAASQAIQRFTTEMNSMQEERGELDPHELIRIAATEFAGVNMPTIVLGTVLDEPDQIKGLLATAEAALDTLFQNLPPDADPIVDAFDVVEEDGFYCLHMDFDSETLPWEELERDPQFEPFVDDLKDLLKDKTVSVSLGIKDNFLLFSIGPSLDHIRNLGQGNLLINHEKLTRLRDSMSGKTLTGVMYSSEASALNSRESMAGMIDSVVSGVTTFLDVSNDEIDADVDGLADDLKADAIELKKDLDNMLPAPGAWLTYSFLTSEGIEGFTLNWAEARYMDSSQPLDLLNHLGSKPVLAAVARDRLADQQFSFSRKWLSRIYDYVTEYVPRNIPDEEDADTAARFMEELRSSLGEIADATEEHLLPTTEAGEFGLVLDFSVRKPSWHTDMPEADIPVPVPAIALVLEIDDAEQVRKAGGRYLKAVADLVEAIRRLPDSDVPPEFQVVSPQTMTVDGIEKYYYSLPAEAGVDSSIEPNALLSDKLLVLSTSADQSLALMRQASPEFDPVLAAHQNKPLMSVVWYDNAEFVDALETWGMYGMQLFAAEGGTLDQDYGGSNTDLNFTHDEVMVGIDSLVDFIRCFRSYSSSTWVDGDVQITHSLMRFVDVEDE